MCCLQSQIITMTLSMIFLAIMCAELSDPENGTVSQPTERTVDSVATYACNGNLQLVGADNVTCQINGTWSAEEPSCAGKCACI